MKPAERDAVLADAVAVRREHGPTCAGRDCQMARAVIAFVPPSGVEAPEGYTIRSYASGLIAIDDGVVMGMTIGARTDDAERLAWALLDAVAEQRQRAADTAALPPTGAD